MKTIPLSAVTFEILNVYMYYMISKIHSWNIRNEINVQTKQENLIFPAVSSAPTYTVLKNQ